MMDVNRDPIVILVGSSLVIACRFSISPVIMLVDSNALSMSMKTFDELTAFFLVIVICIDATF